ncbi:alpha-1,2-fucosyltransferase [Butyrivibrio fibrisolvens]|uniref:alpha-1,2-fucosyltransferase n=1 Tax=Butyrivibrio fibrisolvens TaxID=831 RepID=UPI001788C216|nr:alpha-1,2-fucosyltransferase [Butyrivibrio fibrisolvens]
MGNQLFQYAFGKVFEKQNSVRVYHDSFSYVRDKKRKYELGQLSISKAKRLPWIMIWLLNFLFYLKILPDSIFETEKQIFVYQEVCSSDYKKYFVGNWQHYKYFDEIKDDLRKEFTLKEVTERLNEIMAHLNRFDNSVMVHVRRGDYLTISDYVVQGREYYENAMNQCLSKLGSAKFVIFSDDYKWCRENIDNNMYDVEFMDLGLSAPEDFQLMRGFHNFIISNSTFSWWPAYLSDGGIKIAPYRWFTNEETNKNVREALLKEFELF